MWTGVQTHRHVSTIDQTRFHSKLKLMFRIFTNTAGIVRNAHSYHISVIGSTDVLFVCLHANERKTDKKITRSRLFVAVYSPGLDHLPRVCDMCLIWLCILAILLFCVVVCFVSSNEYHKIMLSDIKANAWQVNFQFTDFRCWLNVCVDFFLLLCRWWRCFTAPVGCREKEKKREKVSH